MPFPRALKSVFSKVDGEAWRRFFFAVAGLTLAFLAAVFSTVTRSAGNIPASVLLASVALMLSTVVGITIVPYLAKRVAGARVREALDFELTREGMAYLGVALVVGIAALNTTNNLLFIVLAAMLAAVVVSGFASAAVLRRLELDIVMPDIAFAGQPLVARIKLRNPRGWFPAFSVRVVTKTRKKKKKKPPLQWTQTQFVFPRKRAWLRLPDYTLRRKPEAGQLPEIFEKGAYFAFVPPSATAVAEVELNFPRRGKYAHNTFHLATRFPFSFLMKSRRAHLERELLVYPALLGADHLLEALPMSAGENAALVRGQGVELYRIREHTPGDPARFVDWKATAKTGALKVREFAREEERRMCVVFDNPGPGTVTDSVYEYAVSLAASLAWRFTGENLELSYVAPGYSGEPYLYDFLVYLALVQPAPGASVLDSLSVSDDFNLVITARAPGSLPPSLVANSHVIYI